MTISLRAATPADAYALWLWANDPATRAASFQRGVIAWDDHVDWLDERLNSPDHTILIAELPRSRPVGTIRFDAVDAWSSARLSYAIAPEARGNRLSRPLVSKGVEWIRAEHEGVAVRADVMRDNPLSLSVFRRLGWAEESLSDGAQRFWYR